MHLLTGATGYVGGRLLRRLEQDGVTVRCLCRNPEKLEGRVAAGTSVVPGDLLDPASLNAAFSGVDTAYYLVHSMHSGSEFEVREREAATNFACAALSAGVRRIIYLGGLAQGDNLSPHMRSRSETGNILRASGVPVIELQASVIIGSGSASYEMIRALVERLPIMVTPRWVSTAAQPIAIEDVIEYLAAAGRLPYDGNLTVEIGGADVTSYAGIMKEFARRRNLRRWVIPVPWLSLSLSSRWLTLITPLYASIGRCLIESVRNPSVVRSDRGRELFSIEPMGVGAAIERALASEDSPATKSRWSDANAAGVGRRGPASPAIDVLRNEQTIRVAVPAEQAFGPIRRIGGRTGWYFGNTLWKIRGLFDQMVGGVGMRRGRPDPETPVVGSTLDFWRVECYEPNRRLRLFAEMKLPGRAWLEFSAEAEGASTLLRQVAEFEPRGFSGLLYWYLLWPIHTVMFRGIARRIGAAAVLLDGQTSSRMEKTQIRPLIRRSPALASKRGQPVTSKTGRRSEVQPQ